MVVLEAKLELAALRRVTVRLAELCDVREEKPMFGARRVRASTSRGGVLHVEATGDAAADSLRRALATRAARDAAADADAASTPPLRRTERHVALVDPDSPHTLLLTDELEIAGEPAGPGVGWAPLPPVLPLPTLREARWFVCESGRRDEVGDGGGTGSSTAVVAAEAALTRTAVACSASSIATTVAVCAGDGGAHAIPGVGRLHARLPHPRAQRLGVGGAERLARGGRRVGRRHAPQRLRAPVPKQRQCSGGCDTDAPRRMRLANVCGDDGVDVGDEAGGARSGGDAGGGAG